MIPLEAAVFYAVEVLGKRLSLRTSRLEEAEAISALLNHDQRLGNAAGSTAEALTPQDVLKTDQVWREKKQAIPMAILDPAGVAIGMISLSHINCAKRTAQMGYFLSSQRWGNGYGTEAVGLALSLAAFLRLQEVTGTIGRANEAALRIRRRYGAEFFPKSNDQVLAKNDLTKCVLPSPAPLIRWFELEPYLTSGVRHYVKGI